MKETIAVGKVYGIISPPDLRAVAAAGAPAAVPAVAGVHADAAPRASDDEDVVVEGGAARPCPPPRMLEVPETEMEDEESPDGEQFGVRHPLKDDGALIPAANADPQPTRSSRYSSS